jgi:hypothetical protein
VLPATINTTYGLDHSIPSRDRISRAGRAMKSAAG